MGGSSDDVLADDTWFNMGCSSRRRIRLPQRAAAALARWSCGFRDGSCCADLSECRLARAAGQADRDVSARKRQRCCGPNIRRCAWQEMGQARRRGGSARRRGYDRRRLRSWQARTIIRCCTAWPARSPSRHSWSRSCHTTPTAIWSRFPPTTAIVLMLTVSNQLSVNSIPELIETLRASRGNMPGLRDRRCRGTYFRRS